MKALCSGPLYPYAHGRIQEPVDNRLSGPSEAASFPLQQMPEISQ